MNHKTLPEQAVESGREMLNNGKSSSFMMENILKPDKFATRLQEFRGEAPSKIKALSVAAQLAGLFCFCLNKCLLVSIRTISIYSSVFITI